MFLFVLMVSIGYLLGSVCSAVIVSKIFNLPDPRIQGSQNPGATNVLRLSGKKYALMVLLADILKGLLPVLLAKLLGAGIIVESFTGLAAVLGHMYPAFFHFKGGKGVATALGVLLALNLILGVLVIATWLLVANFARYSSLASIVSIVFAPFYSLFIFGNLNAFPPLLLIALFVLYKHRNNITRLTDGTEPKINFRKKMATDFTDTPLAEESIELLADEEVEDADAGINPTEIEKK
ncbi:glycerol-3-phosphate 1-O-acyltransferase [Legionella septentrionalis]|uniref:Glycerol-3-phosphate acyltransferase n=2 Tax=Legionellaceae TaxID=444 RepID=A0A433JLW5_9GAMM|nr:glycerol-3-phosphate 1-O-acyltransferase PlsY [Legionella septentrionalis]RUQ90812.1 glycerol-3-phosphate 1-O-acyltransferase [Legionella septentrionalis]RUQ95034.1 glycerol-3-phosphate 1-O-acyltransferase [Legionella septentrionalis]RUR09213.1 glycerol-3-phosphate 1-O-acyltransferase [Legionella septentrionalis]RUR13955.1 glycerol-3-phosphate 1-O-acyltransferase [Legionella septentrionalis]